MGRVELQWARFTTFVFCQGWGGNSNREYIDDTDARLVLVRETQEIEVTPHKRGEAFTIPMGVVKQWKRKPASDTASMATSSSAPAKARAASVAKSSA